MDGVGAGANDAEGTLAGVARAPVAATLLPAQLFALGGGGCHRLACITDLPTCPMVCLACAGAPLLAPLALRRYRHLQPRPYCPP